MFLWTLSLVVGSMQLPSTGDALRQAVVCAEVSFSRAVERRDREGFAAFLDDDSRFVSTAVSRGTDAILKSWAGFFEPKGPRIRWRPATVEVNAAGNLALSRGPYRIEATDAQGRSSETWGHFITTWRLDSDGSWRVQFDTGGDDGMTPSDAMRRVLASESGC